MIYCTLIKSQKEYATYSVGTNTNNITGEVKFFNKLTQPVVVRHPNAEKIPDVLLSKIVVKYKKELENGNFPNKMSYEN